MRQSVRKPGLLAAELDRALKFGFERQHRLGFVRIHESTGSQRNSVAKDRAANARSDCSSADSFVVDDIHVQACQLDESLSEPDQVAPSTRFEFDNEVEIRARVILSASGRPENSGLSDAEVGQGLTNRTTMLRPDRAGSLAGHGTSPHSCSNPRIGQMCSRMPKVGSRGGSSLT